MADVIRRRTFDERETYYLGFKAGANAVIDHLRSEFPGLEHPESGGPVAESERFLASILSLMQMTALGEGDRPA